MLRWMLRWSYRALQRWEETGGCGGAVVRSWLAGATVLVGYNRRGCRSGRRAGVDADLGWMTPIWDITSSPTPRWDTISRDLTEQELTKQRFDKKQRFDGAERRTTQKLMDGGDESDSNGFICNICYERAEQDPIVTHCGHLDCWPCLYTWLHRKPHASNRCPCPVCKAIIVQSRLIPLYGIGRSNGSDPRLSVPSNEIPDRPAAPRFTARPASTSRIYVKLFCRLLISSGEQLLKSVIESASNNLVKSLNRRFHGSIEAQEVRRITDAEGSSNHSGSMEGAEVRDNNGDGSSLTSVLDNGRLHELIVLEQSSDW